MLEGSEPFEPKTIALDWDDTFTTDPELWRLFVRAAKERGHLVVIVTARSPDRMAEPNAEAKRLGIDALATNGQPKIKASDNAGYIVNIWIDDMPGLLFESVNYG